MPTETPFFFPSAQSRLFGVLHQPTVAASHAAFLLCHPFGEEKLWSHRVFVSFARALAARGHAVLRFDFLGSGDSTGTTTDTSLETHLTDVGSAADALLGRQPAVRRLGLVGLRLGASFAALYAERNAESGRHQQLLNGPLVLWDPVLDGEAYFLEVLRANLSAQLAAYGKVIETREKMLERILAGGTANVDGYEIGLPLYSTCARPDILGAGRKRHAGPVLVTPIAPPGKTKPRADLDAFAQSYGRGDVRPAAEHPFWREIRQFYARAETLSSTTLEWLERTDA